MRLTTISQFSKECDCSYEAIRQRIGKSIFPIMTNPVAIDADKYYDLMQKIREQARKYKSTTR